MNKPNSPPKPKPTQSNPSSTALKTIGNIFGASTEIPNEGKFILTYGPPGEGKTTFASQFPKPIFLITHGETGIHSAKRLKLAEQDIPVIELPKLFEKITVGTGHPAWDKVISTLETFANKQHDRKTLVIDTLSGLESICFQHCASLDFDGDMKSRSQDCWNHYASGPRKAAEVYWQNEFLNKCIDAIRKGLNIVLIGHSSLRLQASPNGPDYQMYNIELSNKILTYTNKVLHHIWFFGRNQEFATEQGTKKRKVKAEARFVGLMSETWYVAKNWDNIQDPVEAGSSAKETYERIAKLIKI